MPDAIYPLTHVPLRDYNELAAAVEALDGHPPADAIERAAALLRSLARRRALDEAYADRIVRHLEEFAGIGPSVELTVDEILNVCGAPDASLTRVVRLLRDHELLASVTTRKRGERGDGDVWRFTWADDAIADEVLRRLHNRREKRRRDNRDVVLAPDTLRRWTGRTKRYVENLLNSLQAEGHLVWRWTDEREVFVTLS